MKRMFVECEKYRSNEIIANKLNCQITSPDDRNTSRVHRIILTDFAMNCAICHHIDTKEAITLNLVVFGHIYEYNN